MPKHPNEDRLEKLYDFFAKGQFEQVLAMCDDDVTFTVPGETAFSGKHTKKNFDEWIGKVWAISDGTFREVPYAIVANEDRGTVLLTHSLKRNGKEVTYRTVHIWDIRDGMFTRWEEWPGNEKEFTTAWG